MGYVHRTKLTWPATKHYDFSGTRNIGANSRCSAKVRECAASNYQDGEIQRQYKNNSCFILWYVFYM